MNKVFIHETAIVDQPVDIGAGTKIWHWVHVMSGAKIGEYAFIGAGSVVTKPVPVYALMVGNSAKQMGWMSRAGVRLEFDEEGMAVCGETGERYTLRNGLCSPS